MRVLIVPAEARTNDALSNTLEARGHRVDFARAPWRHASKRRELALAADVTRRAITSKVDVAYVEGTHRTSAVTAALTAAKIPYVLGVDRAVLAAPAANGTETALVPQRLPITVELCRQAVRLSMKNARATVVPDRGIARHLHQETGVPTATIAEDGLDLSRLPLGARDEARRALRLPEGTRFVALIADLTSDLPYELLLFAHRATAGTGLLVAGDGPGANQIGAMTVATRPSAPVIHVGPKSEAVALAVACAADVGLTLTANAPETRLFAALGRRQVMFDAPEAADVARLYPAHDTVFTAPPVADALAEATRRAIATEREAGPLPFWAVEAARKGLGRTRADRIADQLESCA